MSDAGTAVPVHDGLWTTAPDGSPRLRGGRCEACGEHHFPRATDCPYCSTDAVVAVELSPGGTLWGWTAVTTAPPGYQGDVPFGFGVVELPEGIRVITRLTEPRPERLAFGQAMRLVLAPLHVDGEGRTVVGYAFAPDGDRP
jgi:uncharacterized OB-fold protein